MHASSKTKEYLATKNRSPNFSNKTLVVHMQFKDQSVIITGASSGIGRATALEFGRRGAKVIVSDIQEKAGEETAGAIKANGGQAIFIKTDVSNDKEVQALVSQCIDHYGKLDNMINNAGVGEGFQFFEAITDDQWHKTIAINQTGVFYCMRAALKVMREQKSGNIINTASAAGTGSAPRMGAYAASKHAVVGMTKTAAVEYGKYGIRVNAICPTVIETPMGDSYLSDNEEVAAMMQNSVPMKRFGKAEEVAKTICWLCGSDASYLNGVALPVDGGFTA